MKTKVNAATNLQLDWMVAKCEGKNGVLHDDGLYRCIVVAAASEVYKGTFKPTTNWVQGGPIIEQEKIEVTPWGAHGKWRARDFYEPSPGVPCAEQYGPTPLIAAMRCFITSKLGDEVEVPEELV